MHVLGEALLQLGGGRSPCTSKEHSGSPYRHLGSVVKDAMAAKKPKKATSSAVMAMVVVAEEAFEASPFAEECDFGKT